MKPTTQAWNPHHYDSAGAFVPKLAGDLLELLAPQPDERVLDLGCGTGDLTQHIAERGARVVGLDASREMLNEARRKHPSLELVHGDGQELTFDNEFDAVFSNATLHWLTQPESAASGVARALRRGGRFVAEFGGARNVQAVRDALGSALGEMDCETPPVPNWYFPTVPAYVAVLAGAGFWVRTATWFERPTPLQGSRGLEDWLQLFCSPLLRALGERRAAVVARTEELCRERLYRDGVWWLDYTRLRVVAEKPCYSEA